MKKIMSIAFAVMVMLTLGMTNTYAQQQDKAQTQAGCPTMAQGSGQQCMMMTQGAKCPMASDKCPMQAHHTEQDGHAGHGSGTHAGNQ